MIKKIWFLLFSVFAIFWFWVSFANPIAIDYDDLPDVCYKLKNVGIDNYKVIIEHGKRKSDQSSPYDQILYPYDKNNREVYELKAKECTKCANLVRGGHSKSKVYLIDKSIDISDITQENIDILAIYIWDIFDSDCSSHYDIINTYKITNHWDSYEIVQSNIKNLEKIRKFPLLRFFAVLIETLVLFFIAKIFWEKDEIKEEVWWENNETSNKKLLLLWIIPTTITLPFLWFVLPLIMWDWRLYIIVWEILVVVIETIMIKYWLNISRKRAFMASIICNIFSFIILLVYSLRNWDSYISSTIRMAIIWLSGFIVVEGAILFIEWKYSKEQISKKRLIIWWLVTPILDILLSLLTILVFDNLLDAYSEVSFTITIIILKVLLDVLVIKWLRKFSRKKCIITSMFCNLCIAAIILALIYFFD